MNYSEARIVLFTLQFGLMPIGNKNEPFKVSLPPYVLNRITVMVGGEPVTFRYEKDKKDLYILQFVPEHYQEFIMEKDLKWKDPLQCFIDDIDVFMQLTDPVIWIFINPAHAALLKRALIK